MQTRKHGIACCDVVVDGRSCEKNNVANAERRRDRKCLGEILLLVMDALLGKVGKEQHRESESHGKIIMRKLGIRVDT